jgi:hypothetical protein
MTSISGTSTISNALSGLAKADQMLMGAVEAMTGATTDVVELGEVAMQLQMAKVQSAISIEVLRTSLELEQHFVDLLA